MSKVGKIFGDELSYPEITDSLDKFSDLLQGGLSYAEFRETDYKKKRLMPKKFKG